VSNRSGALKCPYPYIGGGREEVRKRVGKAGGGGLAMRRKGKGWLRDGSFSGGKESRNQKKEVKNRNSQEQRANGNSRTPSLPLTWIKGRRQGQNIQYPSCSKGERVDAIEMRETFFFFRGVEAKKQKNLIEQGLLFPRKRRDVLHLLKKARGTLGEKQRGEKAKGPWLSAYAATQERLREEFYPP